MSIHDRSYDEFLRVVLDHPVLTRNEERKLVVRAQAGDKRALDELVRCNMKLVFTRVEKWKYLDIEHEDALSIGVMGLMHAISKFKIERGNKLSTYAIPWIDQYITRTDENESRSMRSPVHRNERRKRIGRMEAKLTVALQRTPTDAEIAEALEETPAWVAEFRHDRYMDSLDRPIGNEDGESDTTLGDLIADTQVEQGFFFDDERIEAAISEYLDGRSASIMRLSLGLGSRQFNYQEIGTLMGISRERVRQIEFDSLLILRRHIDGWVSPYLEDD